MCTIRPEDRVSLCSFTFADGRRCRIPRGHGHYLCTFHARREAKIFAGEKVGEEIARYLSGEHVPAGDLCSALGRLFAAVAQGQVEPKTIAALAHLGRSLVQAFHAAQEERALASGAASTESATLQDTPAPTQVSTRRLFPNPSQCHQPPKHPMHLDPRTSPKTPSSPIL
jgi:hypothetical protein